MLVPREPKIYISVVMENLYQFHREKIQSILNSSYINSVLLISTRNVSPLCKKWTKKHPQNYNILIRSEENCRSNQQLFSLSNINNYAVGNATETSFLKLIWHVNSNFCTLFLPLLGTLWIFMNLHLKNLVNVGLKLV